jgi:hypothetical protein
LDGKEFCLYDQINNRDDCDEGHKSDDSDEWHKSDECNKGDGDVQ